MTASHSKQSDLWQDQFKQLDHIIQSDLSLSQQLQSCADTLRGQPVVQHSRYLQRQIEEGIVVLDQAAKGDYTGISRQFCNLVRTPLEETEQDHLLVLIVKDIESHKAPHPLLIHCTLDRRALQAQQVLRSAEFVDRLAARLGVATYSDAALASRVQGVRIINRAGYVRYAVFADLVYEMDWTTSYIDGGLLFSVVAEEFIDQDLALVEVLFPEESRRLRELGVLDSKTVDFLFNIFLVLHDTLGHTVPFPVHHWAKRLIGSFMLDPFEELGADTQFFWMTTSEKMKPFLAQVLTEQEAEALPILWLLKRLCHYTQREVDKDLHYGNLMEDGDARTGVVLWQYLLTHKVIVPVGGHFQLDHDLLPAVIEGLLDDWLAVEAEIPGGVEAYSRALSDFYLKYRSSDPITGKWEIPVGLRRVS